MREIEKIQEIRNRVFDPVKRSQMDEAVERINSAFEDLVTGTFEGIKEGKRRVVDDFDDALKDAFKTLYELGKETSVDFPEVKTKEEISVFVVKYGTEVLQG